VDATENQLRFSTDWKQEGLFEKAELPPPGSMDDSALVRETLVRAIKESGKSRAQIADEMSRLTGRTITEITLNKFSAESRTDYRWPAELDRAFCAATGDDQLLRCRAERAGYRVITKQEYELLELGREYLKQKRASEHISVLEKRLQGVDL